MGGKATLSVEVLAVLLRVMEDPALPANVLGRMKQLYTQSLSAYPAVVSAVPGPEELPSEDFPNEVEEEANTYYQRIYESEQLSIAQVCSAARHLL